MNIAPPPPGFGRAPKKEEDVSPVTINEKVSRIFATTLTERHQQDQVILRYILKYVECRHNGEACKSVGISAAEGSNLRKYSDISEAIKKIAELTTEEFGYTAADMVQRLKDIAEFDPRCIYNEDGTFKHIKDLPFEAVMSIKNFECKNIMEKDGNGIETGRMIGQVMKYEFYDRTEQVKTLGKQKDVFKDKKVIENNHTYDFNEKLLAGLQRAEQSRLGVRDVTPGDGDE